MTLQAVRSHLSIALALVAAIAGAYAYITNLHYENLETRYEQLEAEKAQVLVANATLAGTVSRMSEQNIRDDRFFKALQASLKQINEQGNYARSQFKELAKNDQVLFEFNKSIVPSSAMRVLYDQASGRLYESGDLINPSSFITPALSSPVAESSDSGNLGGRTFKLYESTN